VATVLEDRLHFKRSFVDSLDSTVPNSSKVFIITCMPTRKCRCSCLCTIDVVVKWKWLCVSFTFKMILQSVAEIANVCPGDGYAYVSCCTWQPSPFLPTTGRSFLPVALLVAEDKSQYTNIYSYEGQPEQPDNLRP
jgi:hypothetical protein